MICCRLTMHQLVTLWHNHFKRVDTIYTMTSNEPTICSIDSCTVLCAIPCLHVPMQWCTGAPVPLPTGQQFVAMEKAWQCLTWLDILLNVRHTTLRHWVHTHIQSITKILSKEKFCWKQKFQIKIKTFESLTKVSSLIRKYKVNNESTELQSMIFNWIKVSCRRGTVLIIITLTGALSPLLYLCNRRSVTKTCCLRRLQLATNVRPFYNPNFHFCFSNHLFWVTFVNQIRSVRRDVGRPAKWCLTLSRSSHLGQLVDKCERHQLHHVLFEH